MKIQTRPSIMEEGLRLFNINWNTDSQGEGDMALLQSLQAEVQEFQPQQLL